MDAVALCENLDTLRLDSDDDDALDALPDRVAEAGYPPETLVAMLHVLENNPDHDFGAPGDLVRAIEMRWLDDGYFSALIDSVHRRPTEYNLWLMNRIMNTFDEGDMLRRGIAVFHQVEAESTDEVIKSVARDFIDYFDDQPER
ncbi:MAG: hypothetical protein FWF36_07445 [Propionibacteriaceae bacterium]|nr:hypothetical protein [Propionibacteriaceae bacterium]